MCNNILLPLKGSNELRNIPFYQCRNYLKKNNKSKYITVAILQFKKPVSKTFYNNAGTTSKSTNKILLVKNNNHDAEEPTSLVSYLEYYLGMDYIQNEVAREAISLFITRNIKTLATYKGYLIEYPLQWFFTKTPKGGGFGNFFPLILVP